MPHPRSKKETVAPASVVTERVLRRIRRMNAKQLVQTLVDAGIIRDDGSLTPRYAR